ncbi:MAG: lipopolysaccharide biosynthesis protein, partial [Acetatifactor sp.]|nr:lipopolysaccharide biosynthesis protein [Acetatifactor sp.]
MIARISAILMGFAARVVFTHTLSEDYVGINGLFTDILSVLALSELGVGTAITYALYRPIAQGDVEKQKSLMHQYRFFYRMVAGMVLVLG